MIYIVVGVVGDGVIVEIERMHCLHTLVPLCVGQVGEVWVVGCWVWRCLVLPVTQQLSVGEMEEEQGLCVCLWPAGRLPLVAGTCAEILFHWPKHSFVQHWIEELGLRHATSVGAVE